METHLSAIKHTNLILDSVRFAYILCMFFVSSLYALLFLYLFSIGKLHNTDTIC